MPAEDIRVQLSLRDHPKWIRLKKRLGGAGTTALIELWLWTAQQRPEGVLKGVSDEEVEVVGARWEGEEGSFLKALKDVGFVSRDDAGNLVIHDWKEHQPWAHSSKQRVARASLAATFRRCKERAEKLPDWAVLRASDGALRRFYGARKWKEEKALALERAKRGADSCYPLCPVSNSDSTPNPIGGGGGVGPSDPAASRPAGPPPEAPPEPRAARPGQCVRCAVEGREAKASAGPGVPAQHRPLGLDRDLCPGHLVQWLQDRDERERRERA